MFFWMRIAGHVAFKSVM